MCRHGGLENNRAEFYSLGLSATLPSGSSLRSLSACLGKTIFRYDISQATTLRNICQYEVFHVGLSFDPAEDAEYQELSERMSRLYLQLSRHNPALAHVGQNERFELLRVLAGDKNP